MQELRTIITKAVASERVVLACASRDEAYNIRQRFYRYRDKIRANPFDEYNLIVDSLVFEIDDEGLVINYNPPTLLERINVN